MQRLASTEDHLAHPSNGPTQHPALQYPTYPSPATGTGPQHFQIHPSFSIGPRIPTHPHPAHLQYPPTSAPHDASPRDKRSSISSHNPGENHPVWAELKTKAGKDRKRLPLACIGCRRKKIRCSGEKPACKHCLKSRTPCVYKVSTRKAGPRTDYMAMLDKRLKRMEERVIKHIPRDDYQNLPDMARAVVKPSQAQQQHDSRRASVQQKAQDQKKRSARDAFGPDLDQWSAHKTSSVTTDGEGNWPRPKASGYDEHNLLAEGRDMLPSLELQQHLAETYFDYVYGQSYHLLHKPSFMKKLAAGNIPPVLILAICAISARFSDHSEFGKRDEPRFLRGEAWSDAAREIAQRRFDYPNITILIVLLLLGLHEFGTCQGGRSWMLGGMAHRMAYALQLHKDPPWDPCGDREKPLSFTDREIRRRTMWACFLMDRFNSSGTVRPMFGSEESLSSLQLPIKENLFENELVGRTELLYGVSNDVPDEDPAKSQQYEGMGVAAYMIRAISLWGRIIQYVNLGGRERDLFPAWDERSGYKKLHDFTHRFHDTLPDLMKYSEDNIKIHDSSHEANQFLYLHIVLKQCVLFLNRNAVPIATRIADPKDSLGFLHAARDEAILAAEQISGLLVKAKQYKVVAPFAGFCAYMSSAVQVVTAFSSKPEVAQSAKENLKINVAYLEYMKHYWGNFYFLNNKLKTVYSQAADMANKGSGSITPDTRAEDPQYGNWFDVYPHGVTRSDFQEPVSEIKKEAGDDAALGEKEHPHSVEQFLATLSPNSKAKHAAINIAGKRPNAPMKKPRRNTATKPPPRRSSQATSDAHSSAASQGGARSFDSMDFREPLSGYPESYDRSPMLMQHPTSTPTLPQHPSMHTPSSVPAGPYGYNQAPPSSYYMPQSTPDPSLTFSSYGGMESTGMGFPDMNNGFWSAEPSYMANQENFWHEPSGAWMAPFNMNIPDYSVQTPEDVNMPDPMQQQFLSRQTTGGSQPPQEQGPMGSISRHNSNAG